MSDPELRSKRELYRNGHTMATYLGRVYYFKKVEDAPGTFVLHIYEQNRESRQWFRLSKKLLCREHMGER